MNLMTDLHWLAGRWLEEHIARGDARKIKTLGYRTVRDSKLFDRLAAGRPISVPIYEKIITYLADVASWPGHVMPADVADRLALAGAKVDGVRVLVERDVVERKLVLRA